jgi:two-component system LytT family response regulator
MFAGRLTSAIAGETLIYFLVVAVLYAFVYASESSQRQIAMARAEAGLVRAQLDAKDLEDRRRQLVLQLEGISNLSQESDSLAVPARDGVVKVPLGSIDWLQAEDNYVRLHAAGRSHLVRTTLGALEKKLASRDFVRIHRSAVVSVSRIARLRRLAPDRYAVVLTDGAQLRVSRAYRKRVVDAVGTPLTPE